MDSNTEENEFNQFYDFKIFFARNVKMRNFHERKK